MIYFASPNVADKMILIPYTPKIHGNSKINCIFPTKFLSHNRKFINCLSLEYLLYFRFDLVDYVFKAGLESDPVGIFLNHCIIGSSRPNRVSM